MSSLLEELGTAVNENYEFHVKSIMFTKQDEDEKIRQARQLEREGYLILTRCDKNDKHLGQVLVTLEGKFKEKGIALISK